MRQKKFVQSRDDFTNYRELCEARLKRLERYKKTRSFCSLEIDEASTSTDNTNCQEDETNANLAKFSLPQHRTPYDLLREKMISLMETDNQLMQQLLTLGDTIKELREKQPTIKRSTSETSLSSGNCEDEENEDELRPMVDKFSASMSAITNLYLNGGDHDEDETENLPNFQYFSRKNSVLRIPIPARASNRILGKKIPRRPSELMRPRFNQKPIQNEVNESMQKIENDQQAVEEKLCQLLQVDDNSQPGQNSPTSSQHSPDNQSTLSSCCENERKATSSASIDSGIRDDDESSSSPLNDHSEAVENKVDV